MDRSWERSRNRTGSVNPSTAGKVPQSQSFFDISDLAGPAGRWLAVRLVDSPITPIHLTLAFTAAGLAAVDELRSPALDGYYLFHAARADLLRRLGRDEEAAAAYDAARALTANPVERAFLDAQRTAVSWPPAAPRPALPRCLHIPDK